MVKAKRTGFARETVGDTDVNVTNTSAVPVAQSDESLIPQETTLSVLQSILEQQKLTNELLKGILQ